jgi:hypothetical protein
VFKDSVANDGFREPPSPYVAVMRLCGILIFGNRSRMRSLESRPRRKVMRWGTTVELGSEAKFVGSFSFVAI